MRATLAAALLMASVVGSLAQGTFALIDGGSVYGLNVNGPGPGNWYSGTFGMEVWELNSTAVPPGVNFSPGLGSGVRGYEAMVAAGFMKEATYANRSTTGPGDFNLYEVLMPHVNPAGATVVVALAAWNTSAPSWSAMLADAHQATRAGIMAVVQQTGDPTVNPGSPPTLTMDQDLVMTAIPEPSGLALEGLGGALMLLLPRRASRGVSRKAGL